MSTQWSFAPAGTGLGGSEERRSCCLLLAEKSCRRTVELVREAESVSAVAHWMGLESRPATGLPCQSNGPVY